VSDYVRQARKYVQAMVRIGG